MVLPFGVAALRDGKNHIYCDQNVNADGYIPLHGVLIVSSFYHIVDDDFNRLLGCSLYGLG